MSSDESTEQAIIAAGASTAPRVTPDDIEANIVATAIVKHVLVIGIGPSAAMGGADNPQRLQAYPASHRAPSRMRTTAKP